MFIKYIYFISCFILCMTSSVIACTPMPFLIYPINTIVLLSFMGILFYKKFQMKHLLSYLITAFIVGLIGPSIPVLLPITMIIGIVIFFTALSDEQKKDRIQKKTLPDYVPVQQKKQVCPNYVYIILALLIFIMPGYAFPLVLVGIVLFCLKKGKKLPGEKAEDSGQKHICPQDFMSNQNEAYRGEAVINENKIPDEKEVPKFQKIIAVILFVTVILTVPLYALHIGTSVTSIILFFSLFLLIIGSLLIRSIIRRTGVPYEEWLSRVVVSSILFLTVAVMTFYIKLDSFFGASNYNYISALFGKKWQFIFVFISLLLIPALCIVEEHMAKKGLKKRLGST